MEHGELAVIQRDVPNGPDIVSIGFLGLNVGLMTDSTPIAKLTSPLYCHGRLEKLAAQPSVLVTRTLIGSWQVRLGNGDSVTSFPLSY